MSASVDQQIRELRAAVLAIAIDLGAALGTNPATIAKLNTLAAYPAEPPQSGTLTLTVDTAAHMLADLDQIISEMENNLHQRSFNQWISMLRRAVDGEDYKR